MARRVRVMSAIVSSFRLRVKEPGSRPTAKKSLLERTYIDKVLFCDGVAVISLRPPLAEPPSPTENGRSTAGLMRLRHAG